ncbi:MAG TPA: T9SS type A sorting domain-containing protein, partial [Ignavibacteria bacterium]|nr:T9SS type A sorting domain-containing protein [Ignavibacteria bacterium]
LNGAAATIWKTTNGTNWVDVGGGVLPNRYPTDIHVNPNNSMDVYAAFGGFGNPHVYRSSNGGANWVNITSNLPDVPHQSICIDPLYTQNIYVGNDLGVYVSTNSGANWAAFTTGMPYALVFDLTIVYPSRNIRATTHGNGIYERDLIENPIGIEPVSNEIPKQFSLSQNFPNPFNPTTKIKFQIPLLRGVSEGQLVTPGREGVFTNISVYDISGRLVKTILQQNIKPGSYEITFDGTGLSSGVYFYKLVTNGFTDAKKMMLVK